MKKLKIYFEIKKGVVIKEIWFITTDEKLKGDVDYYKWLHKLNGWNIKYLGFKEVK